MSAHPQVDNSSVIEIDFIRSDIFEEVLNYMYTAKISVKKRDVNLMMSSGQILGIRFLDKLCSQVTHTGGAAFRGTLRWSEVVYPEETLC